MNRLKLLKAIVIQFLTISTIVRIVFIFWSFKALDFAMFHLASMLFTGLFFDIGVISYFIILYVIYLLLFPNKWVGNLADKIFNYFFYFTTTLIFTFSFFAEFTFWEEFKTRFNFIAVDYLIYTFEVIENINQSYPIPLLLTGILIFVAVLYFILKQKKIFSKTFTSTIASKQKLQLASVLLIPVLFTLFINNKDAEWSENTFENEIAKAGIYSFFAAFRNNELSYPNFYLTQNLDLSFQLLKSNLKEKNSQFISNTEYSIARKISNKKAEIHPNVIFICVESLSAKFLKHFGNKSNISPNLDALLNHSVYFENLYATGTRTVRGMEAITLSIPPSPGRSIVKRENNKNLNNIGNIFKAKGYHNTFYYGGDGYFDNMNEFFGGNGFDIVDRGRGYLFGDSFTAKRMNINDNEVSFENAWGICDEDLYNKVIKEADKNYKNNTPFFDFIMTTSNHRPFTYPNNKIDKPSGSGREGAVKYTDFAIGEFIKNASSKPWFKNTVFVIMADHCASSAGKWELNVSKYHIPAIIYNLPHHQNKQLKQQCSQIDIFPTLFGLLNWSYTSNFYGKDVTNFNKNSQRALIGNYRKLGLLQGDTLVVLGDQKKANFYYWDKKQTEPASPNQHQLQKTIAYYQTIDYLYQHNLLKDN